mgnify:CR=1 FL=1
MSEAQTGYAMADHRASHVVLSVGCLKKIGHSGRSAASTPNHAMFGGGYNSNSNSNSNSYSNANVSRMNSPLQPPPSEARSIMSSISGPFHGLVICVTGLSRGLSLSIFFLLSVALYSKSSL